MYWAVNDSSKWCRLLLFKIGVASPFQIVFLVAKRGHNNFLSSAHKKFLCVEKKKQHLTTFGFTKQLERLFFCRENTGGLFLVFTMHFGGANSLKKYESAREVPVLIFLFMKDYANFACPIFFSDFLFNLLLFQNNGGTPLLLFYFPGITCAPIFFKELTSLYLLNPGSLEDY